MGDLSGVAKRLLGPSDGGPSIGYEYDSYIVYSWEMEWDTPIIRILGRGVSITDALNNYAFRKLKCQGPYTNEELKQPLKTKVGKGWRQYREPPPKGRARSVRRAIT